MRQISSEQLWHFVKSKDHLTAILKHNFYPRLCLEDQIRPFFKTSVYVPMKCFCDIPIKMMAQHMTTYGNYGIGFKKEWGLKTGLTPVVYYNPESPFIKYMIDINNRLVNRLPAPDAAPEKIQANDIIHTYISLYRSFTMYKPVHGPYPRIQCDHYCYYDEREWRYILPPDSGWYLAHHSSRLDDDFWQKVISSRNEEHQKNHQIEFTYEDIDFVIIPTEDQKTAIINELKQGDIKDQEIRNLKLKLMTYSEVVLHTAG